MSDLLDGTSWVVTEFADADLGDLRRTQRLLQPDGAMEYGMPSILHHNNGIYHP